MKPLNVEVEIGKMVEAVERMEAHRDAEVRARLDESLAALRAHAEVRADPAGASLYERAALVITGELRAFPEDKGRGNLSIRVQSSGPGGGWTEEQFPRYDRPEIDRHRPYRLLLFVLPEVTP